jgi:mannosyltransferase OCH1-like enzyme
MGRANLFVILVALAFFVTTQFQLFNRISLFITPSFASFLFRDDDGGGGRIKKRGQTALTYERFYHQIPLDELTKSSRSSAGQDIVCQNGTFVVLNRIESSDARRLKVSEQYHIPRIIHQTSRTRCLVQDFVVSANKWKELDGYDYYFHDDEAMERLVQNAHPAFPLLAQVWNSCVTMGAMKADLWRVLVLWEYGGIFSDLDARPNHFTADTILPLDDSVFVIDYDNLTSFHFMAVAPRHPMLFIHLQLAISNLLSNKGRMNPVRLTGPSPLRSAIVYHRQFGERVDSLAFGVLPAGEYRDGMNGKSIRILESIGGDRDYWVVRETSEGSIKNGMYRTMNMSHFTVDMRSKKRGFASCAGAVMSDLDKRHATNSTSSMGHPQHQNGPIPLSTLTKPMKRDSCYAPSFYAPAEGQSSASQQIKYNIPRIVHQASPQKCRDEELVESTAKSWTSQFWDYYLHDDTAQLQLLRLDHPFFPNLPLVADSCLIQEEVKRDLWRLAVLWEYGGSFAELDSTPNHLTADTIQPDDDAVLIMLDGDDKAGSVLSVDFIAVSPRHPLIFFAVQHALITLSLKADLCEIDPKDVTGAKAIEQGLSVFLNVERAVHPRHGDLVIRPGETHPGVGGRKVRILKNIDDDNNYWISPPARQPTIRRCGTVALDQSGESCVRIMLQTLFPPLHFEPEFTLI